MPEAGQVPHRLHESFLMVGHYRVVKAVGRIQAQTSNDPQGLVGVWRFGPWHLCQQARGGAGAHQMIDEIPSIPANQRLIVLDLLGFKHLDAHAGGLTRPRQLHKKISVDVGVGFAQVRNQGAATFGGVVGDARTQTTLTHHATLMREAVEGFAQGEATDTQVTCQFGFWWQVVAGT